jgi:hypothetical protein
MSNYNDILNKQNKTYLKYANYLRCHHYILTENEALDFFKSWCEEQTIQDGELKGKIISKMLMFAILSLAIFPEEINEVGISNTKFGWILYHQAKNLEYH